MANARVFGCQASSSHWCCRAFIALPHDLLIDVVAADPADYANVRLIRGYTGFVDLSFLHRQRGGVVDSMSNPDRETCEQRVGPRRHRGCQATSGPDPLATLGIDPL